VRPQGADGKRAERTRGEQLQADGHPVTLPNAPPYLLAWLHSLGMCQRGESGPVPLPAVEISAWASGAGHRLQPWEFEALQDASRAFCAEYQSENTQPPDGQALPRISVIQQFKGLAQRLNSPTEKPANP